MDVTGITADSTPFGYADPINNKGVTMPRFSMFGTAGMIFLQVSLVAAQPAASAGEINLPREEQAQMMQFPPLQSMHFPKAPAIRFEPVPALDATRDHGAHERAGHKEQQGSTGGERGPEQ